MEETKEIRTVMAFILRKLMKMHKIGGAHTALRNITKGMPIEFTSSKKGQKIIKKALKELVNRGYLLAKPSTQEIHVSINPRKYKEIAIFLDLSKEK